MNYSNKEKRHITIKKIVQSCVVQSQDQLAELLEAEGIFVTQTTLSRDLSEINVLKGAGGYTFAGDSIPEPRAEKLFLDAMYDLVYSVALADSLVILRTKPGHAMPVAYAVDQRNHDLVIGNIAGDDTVFIATASSKHAKKLYEEWLPLAGG